MGHREQDQNICNHYYKESFNFLLNCIEDYLFIVDLSGRIIQANRAAMEKLEYSLDEIASLSFELLYPMARRLEIGELFKGILSGEIFELSLPLCTKSGREIPVHTRLHKGQLEGNDVLYGMSKEVSEAKTAESYLKKALGCQSSMAALSRFDTGEYIKVNDKLVQTLGYEKDEILGKCAKDLNLFFDPQFRDNVIKAITEQGCVINCEVKIRDKIGNVHTGLFLAEMLEIANNKFLLTITNDITETRMQEKEEQIIKNIQSLIEAMPFLAWVKDIKGRYIAINKAYEVFYQTKSKDIIGKTDFDIFPYQSALNYSNKDKEITELKINQKLNRVHLDNKKYDEWFEVLVLPIFEDNGKVSGTMGVANNITAQVRLEMELANQKRFLKTIIDTIPDFIFYKDINSKLLGCNKGFAERVFGGDEVDVIGKSDFEIVKNPELAKFYRLKDQETFASGKMIKNEEEMVLVDGSVIDAETVKAPFWDDQGNLAGLIGISRDITKRKSLEKQLREKAEYAELLFRTVPSAVLSVDKNRKITGWNKIAEEITGYSADEVMGKECSIVLHGVGIEGCNLCSNACGSPLINQLCNVVTKEGEIRHVLKSIAEVKDDLGEIREKIECFEDITELRASEEKFKQCAETINEIFLITNKEKIIYVSPAYERITGMSCQSLLNNPHALVELIYLADRERMRISFPQSFLNMSKAVTEEFRIVRPDGEMRWLWLQSYPVQDQAINSSFKATSIVDITDRKKIEEKLFEREKQTQMEILLAERVQRESLPLPFVGAQVRVSTIFEPYSTVSGDFFNYKWFEEQKTLCGYIIDVSGHGVATSLQTATFKMMLDNELLHGEMIDAEAILKINQKVMDYLYQDTFVALLYFEFDLKAQILKLVSAGITLFLVSDHQNCSLIPISGCYLGIVDNPEIEIRTIPFKAGEMYCMMSDGVSDLIELNGIVKQKSSVDYKKWLERLAQSTDRNDDFSVIFIEILEETEAMKVLDIKNNTDLENAQVCISEFLERNIPKDAATLEVAINEALNNGYSAAGRVQIKLRRTGGRLIIRVKDYGPGFDITKVNLQHQNPMYDETFEEIRDADSGRGILLMKLFCDKVIYNAKGNEVLLLKHLTKN